MPIKIESLAEILRSKMTIHSRVFVKIKRDYLTDSGMSRGKKMVNSPGAYTTLRSTRQDLSQLAIDPNSISPMVNMQHMMLLAETLFFTPIISTPANEVTRINIAVSNRAKHMINLIDTFYNFARSYVN